MGRKPPFCPPTAAIAGAAYFDLYAVQNRDGTYTFPEEGWVVDLKSPAYTVPDSGILVGLENGEYITITVKYGSCGDLGSRIWWVAESTDGRRWQACFGSMDDLEIDNDWSDDCIASISGVYGCEAQYMLWDALDASKMAYRIDGQLRYGEELYN